MTKASILPSMKAYLASIFSLQVSQAAVNRWTDNIFSIKSWCKNKFFIEEEVLNKQFDIPEELDYI